MFFFGETMIGLLLLPFVRRARTPRDGCVYYQVLILALCALVDVVHVTLQA